jgi:2-polyprenyl-3-methyl-5-hydroxy-6-metoxy-1,4-benzoquinol methylase
VNIQAFESQKKSSCPVCSKISAASELQVFDDRFGFPGRFPVYHCNSCGHRYLQAAFSDEQVKNLYTQYYPRSGINVDGIKPFPALEGFKDWREGNRRAVHQVPKKVRVLDIGCGFGETLLYHKSRGCEAYGVEADENALKSAEKFGLNIKIGVFEPGMFPEAFFDYVTMDQVIEHVPNPKETLREIAKILKPGGRFVFTTPNGAGLGARIFGEKWIHWHAPYHLQYFSKASIRKLVAESDFDLVSLKQVTCAAWLHYQWIHLAKFPIEGEPSAFWAASRVPQVKQQDPKSERTIARIHKFNNMGGNEWLTRALDFLGIGDNFLGTLVKRS